MQRLHYIKLFTDLQKVFRAMDDDEVGRLFKALFDYANGDEPKIDGAEKYLFMMLCLQLDRDAAAYDELSQKNSENGRRGGRPRSNANENRPLFSETDRFQKKPTAFSENRPLLEKSDRLQDKDKDKDKEEYNSNSKSIARAREDDPGSSCSPGVVAYIDANIGSLTPGNFDELSALMDEGITDELVQYAVDEAVKDGARNAGYVFGILRRLRDNGIKSAGDAKRAAEEFRRKRDAGAGRGKIPFGSVDKRTANDFNQRTVTDDEFENGFYTDVMNLGRGGDSK